MKGMRQKFSGKRGTIRQRPNGKVIRLRGLLPWWRIK